MTRISLLGDSVGAIAVSPADLLPRAGNLGGRVQEAATGESLEPADLAPQSDDCVVTLLEQGGRIELRGSHA